jgi:hypothetical protein
MNVRTANWLLLALAMAGCATGSMAKVLQEKQEGKARTQVYAVSMDQAWQIAETVLRWDGAGPLEEHRDQNFLLTTKFIYASGDGTDPNLYIGVWLEPAGGAVKVSFAISGPQTITRFPEDDYEAAFQRRFQQAAAFIQAGQPLPIQSPKPIQIPGSSARD